MNPTKIQVMGMDCAQHREHPDFAKTPLISLESPILPLSFETTCLHRDAPLNISVQ
ncbi:hypothetical protein [Microcoleus sp. Pol11C3]|uniref:hypothetical protein n=1 Tax=Microcoleus sp. Pol11C3 TaxID=3055390 RepID=UPI002FD60370